MLFTAAATLPSQGWAFLRHNNPNGPSLIIRLSATENRIQGANKTKTQRMKYFPVTFPLPPKLHEAAESWGSHLEDQVGSAHRRSPCSPQPGVQRSTGVLFSRALLRQSVTFFITNQTHEKPVAAGAKNSALSGKMGTTQRRESSGR